MGMEHCNVLYIVMQVQVSFHFNKILRMFASCAMYFPIRYYFRCHYDRVRKLIHILIPLLEVLGVGRRRHFLFRAFLLSASGFRGSRRHLASDYIYRPYSYELRTSAVFFVVAFYFSIRHTFITIR